MSTDLYSSGFVRYPSVGTYTGTGAAITGPLVSQPASTAYIQNGGAKPKPFRTRGVNLTFSANADNATGNFQLWAKQSIISPTTGVEITGGPVIDLGTGTFTAGNIVSPIAASDFMADTITFTPSGFLTGLLTTLGAATPLVWSPGNNTPAMLRIEDLGNHDIYVNVWLGTATDIEVYAEVNT